ncbi:MmcB family DNA repair protein [Phaeobacter sp. B1627]|uniref:MmcB family DNA repair protein n=1 Tax=Phaeobacter sp. B1627 TaxID=2583809 RepID=UPI00111A46E6|nr:MmcB family DNA repair protein [Phaeobacter sp. B1627]TNJ41787.1 MmcB family DNA repair protein [Phaeobacter sp. B1627]
MTSSDIDHDDFADGPEPATASAGEVGRAVSLSQPGQRLARGVSRYLRSMGYVSVEEFVPDRGLRVDVMALGPKGELWVIECKSSRADYQSDAKWQGYLQWCDRYFWAVDMDFPTDLLPQDTGLILADAYSAEVIRMGPEQKMSAPRRKKLIQKFAMDAARRLQKLRDPRLGAEGRLILPRGTDAD